MEPSSGLFVGVTWLVAVASAVAVVVVWGKLARPTVLSVLARAATQLVTMTLAVLAVATTLNYQNGWYATWSDLGNSVAGTAPVANAEVHAGAAPLTHYDVRAITAADRRSAHLFRADRAAMAAQLHLNPNPGPDGQFRTVEIPGGGFRRPGNVLLWFPPSYGNPQAKGRQYPVIEAFHGTPGGPSDFQHTASLVPVMKSMIASGKLAESVVVMPNFTPMGLDTECADTTAINMETWLTATVPEWVKRHLQVMTDRTAWATMGYSAGGWCSAMAGALHPRQYAASIVLGGYFKPEFSNWAGHIRDPKRYNLIPQMATLRPNTAFWVEIASADHLSGRASQRFVHSVQAPTSMTSVTFPDAGHRMAVWVDAMPLALSWLGRTLPAFSQSV